MERMRQRMIEIDKIMSKLDNALGKLNDDRLERIVFELEKESNGISKRLQYYEKQQNDDEKISEQYKKVGTHKCLSAYIFWKKPTVNCGEMMKKN